MKKIGKFVVAFLCAFLAMIFITSCTYNVSKDGEITSTKNTFTVSFDLNGAKGKISSQEVEKGSKAKKPTTPTREGYTFLGWYYQDEEWSFIGYIVTEDMVLQAKWEPLKFTIDVINDEKYGSVKGIKDEYDYESTVTFEVEENPGYKFHGWVKDDLIISTEKKYSFTMPLSDLTLKTSYVPADDTKYTVNHLFEDLNQSTYSLGYTEVLTGTTNESTQAYAIEESGFTPEAIDQRTINPDGSTVVNVYYTRNSYNLVFDTKATEDDGYFEFSYNKSNLYDDTVILKIGVEEGYSLKGFYNKEELLSSGSNDASYEAKYKEYMNIDDNYDPTAAIEIKLTYYYYEFKMPAIDDYCVTAIIVANTDTKYTVEYYKQGENGNYTLDGSEIKYGTTGTLTEFDIRSYDGYKALTYDNKVIMGNGTTVIRVYYDIIYYQLSITCDSWNGYVDGGNGVYRYGDTVTLTAIPMCDGEKTGASISSWMINNTNYSSDYTIDLVIKDSYSITVNWTYYSVTTTTNKPELVDQDSSFYVSSGEDLKITANDYENYTFLGWYFDDTCVSLEHEISFVMGKYDVKYVAKYVGDSFNVSIVNDEDIDIDFVNNTKVEYNTNVVITTSNVDVDTSIIFTVKNTSGTQLYKLTGKSCTFKMPNCDIVVDIATSQFIYERNGNVVTFGSYPQTKVTDSNTISTLTTLVGQLPTSDDHYYWKVSSYRYLSKVESEYVYYMDLDIDSDNFLDYRAVYFTKYIGYNYSNSGDTSSNVYENGYRTNTLYFFKYDYINWNILSEDTTNGTAILYTDKVIDALTYDDGANNSYVDSIVRTFINDDFYNWAFSKVQKNKIVATLVDNSNESTGNHIADGYSFSNTYDNVFLLSYKEADSISDKRTRNTEYAKCFGAPNGKYQTAGYSTWWLRSPIITKSSYGTYANQAYNVTGYPDIEPIEVYYNRGIRPALTIKF